MNQTRVYQQVVYWLTELRAWGSLDFFGCLWSTLMLIMALLASKIAKSVDKTSRPLKKLMTSLFERAIWVAESFVNFLNCPYGISTVAFTALFTLGSKLLESNF